MENNKLKIVVIDDNVKDIVLIREMLSNIIEWDLQYHGFTDYNRALQELEAIDPSIILIDYWLNVTDGLVVYKSIKNSGINKPVVMITGQSDDDIASQAILDGVEDYICKNTISPESLKITILNAFEKHKLKESEHQHQCDLENRFDQRTAELANANLFTQQILEAIPSTLISLDENNIVTGWNRVAEQTFGLLAKDAIGKPLLECSIPWDWKNAGQDIQTCRSSKSVTTLDDISYIKSDGNDGTISLTLNIVKSHHTDTEGVLIVGTDLTERKALEFQLNQSQKLKAIGRLAAGIAHEITTPTQFINDNTRFLMKKIENISSIFETYEEMLNESINGQVDAGLSSKISQALAQCNTDEILCDFSSALSDNLSGIERLTQIIKAMRELSHPGSDKKVNVDINHSIDNTITITKNEWKYVADIKTDLDRSLPVISAFSGEIEQVLINMIVNASHAIADVTDNGTKGRGTITVITRNMHNDSIEIQISDTGCGITEKNKEKIFQPFFTTKDIGKGTGQGLAIAYDIIVNKMNGTIDCESEMGHGTTFIITIPCQPAALENKCEMV